MPPPNRRPPRTSTRGRSSPDAPARGAGRFSIREPHPAPHRPATDRSPLDLLNLATLPALTPPPDFLTDCEANGIAFDDGDLDKLGRYLAMLLAANDLLNLTAITDPNQAWRRHIFDSLTLLQLLAELPDGSKILDVGSGGGLPGIPLAICAPLHPFTLLEATGKKVLFLRAVASTLNLTNVTVHEARAESAGHDRGVRIGSAPRAGGHREQYDLVLARAVGRLATLAELTIPFVKTGARAALIKGQQAPEELTEAAKALHLLKAVHEGTIDTPTGKIVVLTKQSATPKDYPRRDGEPKRVPLGTVQEKPPRPQHRSEPPASAGGRKPTTRAKPR